MIPSLPVMHAGEMGERILAFDWSATSLGALETWPDVLRNTLGTVLASRYPMLVWWGPEMLQLYNDPYAEVLGDKHPRALGRSGREVWAEIWDVVGPLAESVRAGGPATWSEHLRLVMQRRGFVEETYFTFSYSPVYDGARVAGVLNTCQETTAHVVGERQMRLLQDLAAVAAQRPDVRSAVELCAGALARDDADVPFSLIFLAGDRPRLVAASGGGDRLDVLRDPATWPLDQVRETWAAVHLPALDDVPSGRWSAPPSRAICLPLPRAGSPDPWGHLVVGLSPLREFDAAYAGFLGLAADHIGAAVGAARASEEERQRLEALAELDRAKTVFFSNASHELRTPLTLMLGPIDELLGSPLPEGARPVVEVLQRNTRRLLRLVNGLLDFARIEGGRVRPAAAPVDLAAYTRELSGIFRAAVERARLELRVDAPALSRPAAVDPAMWERILLNLLSNAFKFTFEGCIEVRLREEDERVVLTVSDTGTGIPATELPRIFERFHRVADARGRTQEGSGIGLALVHELVRLHGGGVEVESEVGRGTTFRVTLPRGEVAGDVVVAQPSSLAGDWGEEALRMLQPEARAPERSTDGPLVLAVDDNADMRDYLRRILGERWRVITAGDGLDALNLARLELPDLIVTDVMMPGIDGFALLRELRDDPLTRLVPVIMLTARAGEEAGVEGLSAGADDYLVKPFGARELVARVQAQLAVARSRRELELQRTILYQLFRQAPAPICVFVGEELRYEMANESYERIVGHREIVGRTYLEVFPELASQAMPEILRRVMHTGEPYVTPEEQVRFARRPGGVPEDAWFALAFAAIPGEKARVMVFAQELTDQVRARRTAEDASRAKDEFLAMLGHELRNPLSPILTALQMWRIRQPGTAQREREVIERQVQHLVRLVDDLLDVSRITRGKLEMQRRPFDLRDAVDRALEQASPLLEQQRHHVEVEAPRGLVIDGDVDRMAQVIANLLTNAAKYTDPGGHVRVRASGDVEGIELSVRDDGRGIDPELLPQLFEQFVQGRQNLDRSQGGLGLGLTIVRNLVRLHGGEVTVHSEGPGRGSEFVLHLPRSERAAQHRSAAQERHGASTGRVLVVDDNVDAAEMLAEVLAIDGFEVRTAHDGPDALAVAADFGPELALLDLGLPVMDGFELARRLRDQDGSIALVALTGYGQPSDRRRTQEAGFDEHLVKPVDLDAVVPAVVRLLRRPDGAAEERSLTP